MKINVIYEDASVLVIDKPSGMLTIPDRHHPEKENLSVLLQRRFGAVFTVHRLDRETSGILVFARHAEAHRALSIQFEHHAIDKFYHVLLHGVLHHEEGEIDKPIGEHGSVSGKMAVAPWGKPSLTFYRVLERFRHFTWAEVQLKTGRTHQIRVHFQHIGYPLAVDALYGPRSALFLSEIKGKAYKKGKYTEEERPLMARTTLHASRIRFDHPESGECMEFRTDLPHDLAACLKQLRRWDAEGPAS